MMMDDPLCVCGRPFSAHGLNCECRFFMEPQPPRRSCFLSLKIGADGRQELAFGLRALADEIEGGLSPGNFVTGGYTLGYTGDLTIDPNMTHDAYIEAIEKFNALRPSHPVQHIQFCNADGTTMGEAPFSS